MHRLRNCIFIVSLLGGSGATQADETVNRTILTQHQRIIQRTGCMKRRMYANRTISYNEAMKVCEARLTQQHSMAKGVLVAAGLINSARPILQK